MFASIVASNGESDAGRWWRRNVLRPIDRSRNPEIKNAAKMAQNMKWIPEDTPTPTPRPQSVAEAVQRDPAMARVTKDELAKYRATYEADIRTLSNQEKALLAAKAAKEKAYAEAQKNVAERNKAAEEANIRMAKRGLETIGKPLSTQAINGAKQYVDFRKSYGAPYNELETELKKVDGVFSTAKEDQELKQVRKQIATRQAVVKILSSPPPAPVKKK